MTPRPDEPDAPVVAFVRELGTWRTAPAPAPGAALRELFASPAAFTPPAAVTPRRTPMSESKRLLTAVPAKIAAGVVGALLAGSLGAGAMTGTISLTSNDSVPGAEVDSGAVDHGDDAGDSTDDLSVVDDGTDADDLGTEVDVEVEGGGAVDDDDAAAAAEEEEPKEPGDPATAPVPTSVSEAAKNHQFDEACGNHGAYVSSFARTGEEPACATTARGGATTGSAPEATEVDVDGSTTAEAEAATPKSHPTQSKASPTGAEKSQAGKAKAATNQAKAPGRARSGR